MTKTKKKPTPQVRTNGFTIWNVPPEVKAKFKATCAQRGVTMHHALVDFMRTYSVRFR